MKSNRLGLAMILVSGFAGAQGSEGTPAGAPVSSAGAASVRAGGEGVVYAKPDQAKIDIGVVTQAATAQAAGSQNAAQTQAVLDRLHSVLGSKADIRTISYSLNPNYQYPHGAREKPSIHGYSASNAVEITSDDLAGIGKVIDAATAGWREPDSRGTVPAEGRKAGARRSLAHRRRRKPAPTPRPWRGPWDSN